MYHNVKEVTISKSISAVNKKIKSGCWILIETMYRKNKILFLLGRVKD